MRVSCIHSDDASIAMFDSAAPAGVDLTHYVTAKRSANMPANAPRAEDKTLIDRARQGADAVVIIDPDLSFDGCERTLPYPELVREAMERLAGRVEVIGSAETVTPGLAAAAEAVGATLTTLSEPPGHAGLRIARLIARSEADHIVLLHASGPIDDTRVRLAAGLALERLAERPLPG